MNTKRCDPAIQMWQKKPALLLELQALSPRRRVKTHKRLFMLMNHKRLSKSACRMCAASSSTIPGAMPEAHLIPLQLAQVNERQRCAIHGQHAAVLVHRPLCAEAGHQLSPPLCSFFCRAPLLPGSCCGSRCCPRLPSMHPKLCLPQQAAQLQNEQSHDISGHKHNVFGKRKTFVMVAHVTSCKF